MLKKQKQRHVAEREFKMDKKNKKIKETLLTLKRISLRFRRQENYIFSLDIHNQERHERWYALCKERNRRYSKLFMVLYAQGIDALKLKVFY